MSEQFVLRWHYQEITLLKNLSTFLNSELLCDCTISVDSHNLKAHRLVLAMCSVYFFQLFQEMGDIQHPVIVLHNVGLDDIKAVLAFIYRGQCMVTKEQLPRLLSVAKSLKIQGLCDMKVPEKHEKQLPPVENENTNTTTNHSKTNETIDNDKVEDSVVKTPLFWEKPPPGFSDLLPPKLEDLSTTKRPQKDASETCKCFLCGKYLSNQYNLRVHMETHEEAYHACQSCPHVSRSRDALRKHVSYRHPEEYHTRKRKKIE